MRSERPGTPETGSITIGRAAAQTAAAVDGRKAVDAVSGAIRGTVPRRRPASAPFDAAGELDIHHHNVVP